MMRMMKWLPVALLGASVCVPAGAAELVVVEAHGVQLAEGQVLDGAQNLKLDIGQSVTVVAQNGQVTVLDGPFNKAPAPDQAALTLAASLQVLTTQRSSDTSSLGAVRKGAAEHEVPQFDLINIADSGDRCVVAGTPIKLWRPNAAKVADTLTLVPGDHSFKAATPWPAGSTQMVVSSDVPFPDAAIYTASLAGVDSTLVFHVIPPTINKPAVMAAWMQKKHCTEQARAIIKTLTTKS